MKRAAGSYHHGDLRNAFLAEAAKIVEREGVAAVTLRELARRVGVSHAASTNHFADRGILLSELAAEGFDELAATLSAVEPRKTPLAHLRDRSRAYVRFALRRPGHYRVMFSLGPLGGTMTPRLQAACVKSYSLFEQVVAAAVTAGPGPHSRKRVRAAAFLSWSVVHGAAMLLLDGPLVPHILSAPDDEAGIAALVDYATATVVRSIATQEPKEK